MLTSAPQRLFNSSFSIKNLGLNQGLHTWTCKADIVGKNSEPWEWSYQTDRQESLVCFFSSFKNSWVFFLERKFIGSKPQESTCTYQLKAENSRNLPHHSASFMQPRPDKTNQIMTEPSLYLTASVRMLIVLVGSCGARKSLGDRIEVLNFKKCLSNSNRDLWFLTWEGL